MNYKRNICEARGYHDWIDTPISSTSEDCESMEVNTSCKICGAVFCASGNWSDE